MTTYVSAYVMGFAQADLGIYRNPFQPHDADYVRFREGWETRNGQIEANKRERIIW